MSPKPKHPSARQIAQHNAASVIYADIANGADYLTTYPDGGEMPERTVIAVEKHMKRIAESLEKRSGLYVGESTRKTFDSALDQGAPKETGK